MLSSTLRLAPNLAALGDLDETLLDDFVGALVVDLAAFELDSAADRTQSACDRPDGRRLAGAVGAEKRYDLAFVDAQRNVPQYLQGAIAAVRLRTSSIGAPPPFQFKVIFAQVRLDHRGVLGNPLGRSLGDHLAVV